MEICDCCKKPIPGEKVNMVGWEVVCDSCYAEFKEWIAKKYPSDAPANIQQQVQPDNGGECTRPDMVDCHAKAGTGGRCMNGVRCPPLQVN